MSTLGFEDMARPTPPAEGGDSLADRVGAEAKALSARGDDLARFLADELERVAQLAAFTHARTPAEYRDRLDAWDEEIAHDRERDAYARGYDHGRRDGRDQGIQEAKLVIRRSFGLR